MNDDTEILKPVNGVNKSNVPHGFGKGSRQWLNKVIPQYQQLSLNTLFWFLIISFGLGLMFTFLPFKGVEGQQWRCLYLTLHVIIGWTTQYMDVVVISFIPLLLAPFLNLASVSGMAATYVGTSGFLYITTAIIGGGLQSVGLDRRFAYYMMQGSSLQSFDVMLRFLFLTAFISMWISNTATAVMVIPILDKMLVMIQDYLSRLESYSVADPRVFKAPKTRLQYKGFRAACYVAMAFGANFGGMVTVVGSLANIAYFDIFHDRYGTNTELNMLNLSLWAVPFGIITLIVCYICLVLAWEGVVIGVRTFGYMAKNTLYTIIRYNPNRGIPGVEEYRRAEMAAMETLGPWSFAEKWMLVFCLITVFCLFFRTPGFFPGWGDLFDNLYPADYIDENGEINEELANGSTFLHDTTTTTAIIIMLFLMPKHSQYEIKKKMDESSSTEERERIFVKMSEARMLNWQQTEAFVNWGVVFMFGCGAVLAGMMETSGLSTTVGEGISSILQGLDEVAMVAVVSAICIIITEFTNNTIMTQIITPVLFRVGENPLMCINPLYISFVGLMSVYFSLMLPIASPSNILVFRAAKLDPMDFMRSGWLCKILGVPIILFCTFTYGYNIMNFGTFPDWALNEESQSCNASLV